MDWKKLIIFRRTFRIKKEGGAFIAPPSKLWNTDFAVFPDTTRCGSTDALFYQLPPTDHDIGFLKLLLFMLFLSRVDVAFLRREFFDLLFLFIFLFPSCSSVQAGTTILLLTCFVPDSAPDFFRDGLALATQHSHFI
jgi:hypothetical protein